MKLAQHPEGNSNHSSLLTISIFLNQRVLSGAQRGQGTLIVESKDTRDNDMNNDNDDDDDNFLIQEEKPSMTRSTVNI